jgi:hypothetical protein
MQLTPLTIDQAKNLRKCNSCDKDIMPKQYHIKVKTGLYSKNLCLQCLETIVKQLKEVQS